MLNVMPGRTLEVGQINVGELNCADRTGKKIMHGYVKPHLAA